MDDLLLFTPRKKSHIAKLDLLKMLLKNGLKISPKISPKKYQLFRRELQYMGNTIFIKDRRVCGKPLRSRLEAIQKLKPPTTIKGCRILIKLIQWIQNSRIQIGIITPYANTNGSNTLRTQYNTIAQ